VVGVAHGAKVGRLPVPCRAGETCRQCVQQTSAHGDEIDRFRVIARISHPPNVGTSTSPQPYGLEGPNLAHLQHIVRCRGNCKQFANIRQRLGYTLAGTCAKIAKLQIWHFFPGGPAPCWGPLPPNFLCCFVDPLQLYKAANSHVSSSYHVQKHRN